MPMVVQVFASIRSPETGETLDRGLVLRFPGPGSFTGQITPLVRTALLF